MIWTTELGEREVLHDLDRHLVSRVRAIQQRELAARHSDLAGIAPETTRLVAALERYLEGGKLLRPRFCFWGGLAALDREPTTDEVEALARMGTAIELVQAAALMHDDVIDHSPTRRGRPAMHVHAAEVHRREGLDGEAEDFGTAVAIVLGDLALTWAEQLAADLPSAAAVGPGARSRALAEFARLRTEVMSGQYLDILHQAGGFDSPADPEHAALEVIRWKTVPYTVLRPVRMGAALMGATDPGLDLLSQWAVEVGTAFQLRDDLLSVVGDEDETGKPTGGDVAEGKRTVLLARTAAATDASGRALLERVVGDPAAGREDIVAVRDLMLSTGAVTAVAAEVRERSGRAAALLEGADEVSPLGRAGLTHLAALSTDVDDLPL